MAGSAPGIIGFSELEARRPVPRTSLIHAQGTSLASVPQAWTASDFYDGIRAGVGSAARLFSDLIRRFLQQILKINPDGNLFYRRRESRRDRDPVIGADPGAGEVRFAGDLHIAVPRIKITDLGWGSISYRDEMIYRGGI